MKKHQVAILRSSRLDVHEPQNPELISLGRQLLAGNGPSGHILQMAVEECGELAVALTAALGVMSEARSSHFYAASVYLAFTQAHLMDLVSSTACGDWQQARAPQLWELLGFAEDALQAKLPHQPAPPCLLDFCPFGGSPNSSSCVCERLYRRKEAPRLSQRKSLCIISSDPGEDRPLELNLSRLLARGTKVQPGFWTLTHHLNRLYARLHGYRFSRPELSRNELEALLSDSAVAPRRIQWAIVRLVARVMEDISCAYVVWLDSDAYIASSEPLEEILYEHGLMEGEGPRLFFFASAAANDQTGLRRQNISDHFFVVRNTAKARAIMEEWWQLPLRDEALGRFREEHFLEQTVMQELFDGTSAIGRESRAASPPLRHFEGFGGFFVRHLGGSKDTFFCCSPPAGAGGAPPLQEQRARARAKGCRYWHSAAPMLRRHG